MSEPARKPLGGKSYGSIAHLPGSRMGPGDHSCHPGQARIATRKVRDRHDRVIVQEKLDGSCCAVYKDPEGNIMALGRAGYLAQTSQYIQHQWFAQWVREQHDRFDELLAPGERVVGEWLAQAHGTRYDLTGRDPFVPFDLMTAGVRVPWEQFSERVMLVHLTQPVVLNYTTRSPLSIEDAMRALEHGAHGFYGATEPVEGAVWRVERDGVVDFLAKYVRPDKVDGRYLPEVSGEDPVYNWMPEG